MLATLTALLTLIAAWGDQGNGTYRNPVINADFSDPDVIRVDDKYYMVASDFHFMGMQMLESADMVNWRYASQIYTSLDFPEYNAMQRYAGGSWAPAVRYHDGNNPPPTQSDAMRRCDEDAIVAGIAVPTFPDRYIEVRPSEHARADLQAAIDSISAAGGGRVVVKPGRYSIAGRLRVL